LRRRITDASGIYIGKDDNARLLIERRLQTRLRVRGLNCFRDYENAIDEKEMDLILDLIAVHETYFFREKRQLEIFADEILPELARPKRFVRIWSAGCSTGEEAYTIAMLMAEQGLLRDNRAEVTASDLSYRVIESSIKGIYSASSFRTTDAYYQDKYFSEIGNGLWRAGDFLRSAVRFEQANLIALSRRAITRLHDGFDVIFCRNVLMYFDEAAVKKTLEALHSLLKKGGFLLLGHAESLLPFGLQFETVQLGREIVHRK
jgi:chemotaxis protein methyltransferase CheR